MEFMAYEKDDRYQQMLEALTQTGSRQIRPVQGEPQNERQTYLRADPVYLDDYLRELGPLAREAYVIGKAVSDGLPIIVDLNRSNARVIHIMSDDWLRMGRFVKALAHGLDVQFQPLSENAEVTYAIITHYPLEWENIQKKHSGRIPLISARTETGLGIRAWMEQVIAEWRAKRQTGYFFLPPMIQLAGIQNGRELCQYLDRLINTPDPKIRFILTSYGLEYRPSPGFVPVISLSNYPESDFLCPDGRFMVKAGKRWTEFDMLQAKP